jgi:hypothetical protein
MHDLAHLCPSSSWKKRAWIGPVLERSATLEWSLGISSRSPAAGQKTLRGRVGKLWTQAEKSSCAPPTQCHDHWGFWFRSGG